MNLYEIRKHRNSQPKKQPEIPTRKKIWTISFIDEQDRPNEMKVAGWNMPDALEWFMFHGGELGRITDIR